jgi:hypothetical protein
MQDFEAIRGYIAKDPERYAELRRERQGRLRLIVKALGGLKTATPFAV